MKYRGQRWVRIGARTVHLVSVMFVGGNAIIGRPLDSVALDMLILSGCSLLADDALRYGPSLLRYLHFWAVVAKIGLLSIALVKPEWTLSLLVAAVVVGSIISHAPGKVRQWAWVGDPGPCAKRSRGSQCPPLPSSHKPPSMPSAP